MADSTTQQPYQFGDVVDGYRWTITGWEPVSPPERTVGVPRKLEARYAASLAAREKAQQQATTEPATTEVLDDAALDGDATGPAESDAGLDAPPTRTVIAAPDLAVEFDEPPVEVAVELATDDVLDPDAAATGQDEPVPDDAQSVGVRAWYGLGWETQPDPDADLAPQSTDIDDLDASFAAALAHGTRALAEQHAPSEIEIAAGIASGAARSDDGSWIAMGEEPVPIDEWTPSAFDAPPQEAPLDELDELDELDGLDGNDAPDPSASVPAPAAPTEPDPAPRFVIYSPAPPQGWYPGKV